MTLGKYHFESVQQFKEIQDKAVICGYETAKDFGIFLDMFFSHLKK